MRIEDRQLCESVLSPGKEMGRQSWVKLMRNGSLLLALPMKRNLALATLNLYQPQKWKGRFLHTIMRALVAVGCHRFLPKFEVKLGDQGLFEGLDALTARNELGFLLGNPDASLRNLIGLYEIEGELCVVKVGCGSASSIVEGEYLSMQRFGDVVAGVPGCRGLFHVDNGVAYVAELVNGRSPRGSDDDRAVYLLLESWLASGERKQVSELDCWKLLVDSLESETYKNIQGLEKLKIVSPVMHGDFAPWNIKMEGSGEVKVLDWEFAKVSGMPGWDGLHFQIQRMLLVDDCSAEKVISECRKFIASDLMISYLDKAGLAGFGDEVLGSYLLYSGRVLSYPREELISLWSKTAD